MKLVNICVLVAVAAVISASPAPESPLSFFDEILPNISDFVEIKPNNYQNHEVNSGRSGGSIENNVEEYLKSHDATFNLPVVGSTVTLSAKNLDNGEVDVKLNFNSGSQVEARKPKLKLKKIFIPIFVFVLIKAMVLIPLALGVLAIKTWNALQLSFVSFVVALAMGVWQLCKKVAGDHAHHPHIVAHDPWAAQVAARSIDVNEAQKLAYSAYAQ